MTSLTRTVAVVVTTFIISSAAIAQESTPVKHTSILDAAKTHTISQMRR